MLLRLMCVAALAAVTAGCQARQVDFRVRLDGNPDATTLRVQVLRGGCAGTPVYTSVFPIADFGAARTPPVLEPENYGFAAEARDADCNVVSSVCIERELPLEGDDARIELVLAAQAPTPACPPAQCMSGACSTDDPDAGPPMRDAGDGDAGPGVDAGPVTCTGDGDCPGGMCRNMRCCNGCWDGTMCQSGAARMACGAAGALCQPCNASQSCIDGTCNDAPRVSMAMSATTTFIRGGGELWSGGANDRMQRGTLLSATPDIFAQMDTTVSFVDVAVTQLATCGVDGGGRLYCWGGNVAGLLGLGSGDSMRSESAPQMIGSDTWLDVEGGNTHFCAIRSDNRLHCWGINTNGQLGVGAAGGSRTSPTEVDGGGEWIDVSLGDVHSCAINTARELFCWGDNMEGQLGIMGAGLTPTPTRVQTGNEWSEISAGVQHTCGILGGDLFCWGDQSSGLLGDGVTTMTNQPTPILIDDARPWTQISAGQFHTCAVTSNNEVYCWGVSGVFGRLGLGDGVEQSTPTLVTSGFDVVEVGWDTSCAANTTDTTLAMTRCWGDGSAGKIGTGRPTTDATPVQPTFEPAP